MKRPHWRFLTAAIALALAFCAGRWTVTSATPTEPSPVSTAPTPTQTPSPDAWVPSHGVARQPEPDPEPVATPYRQYGLFTSRYGKAYHEYWCQSVRRDIKHENFVVYETIGDAKASGRRACRWCKPE